MCASRRVGCPDRKTSRGNEHEAPALFSVQTLFMADADAGVIVDLTVTTGRSACASFTTNVTKGLKRLDIQD